MTRPTATQVWRRLVDEAGEDEIAAVLSMSQEQVDAELAGAGLDLHAERARADRFLEDFVSGALDESLGFRSETPDAELAPTRSGAPATAPSRASSTSPRRSPPSPRQNAPAARFFGAVSLRDRSISKIVERPVRNPESSADCGSEGCGRAASDSNQ